MACDLGEFLVQYLGLFTLVFTWSKGMFTRPNLALKNSFSLILALLSSRGFFKRFFTLPDSRSNLDLENSTSYNYNNVPSPYTDTDE